MVLDKVDPRLADWEEDRAQKVSVFIYRCWWSVLERKQCEYPGSSSGLE